MSFHTLPTLQFAGAEISANPPDILITDPLYPSSDGRRLIKAALDAGCGAVIAVSAAAGERAVTDVLDAGADDFIRKPFLSGELLARVRAAFAGLRRLKRRAVRAFLRSI